MPYEKAYFLHFFSLPILNRETFTFLSLIAFSISDDTDLLTAFPFGNKDENTSGLSIYLQLPPRRGGFSSWLSNESAVKWLEHTWIALDKTGLAIALVQASLIFFLFWPGVLWYETFLFNLDWFEQHFTHQVTIFVSSKVHVSKLYLKAVSLNDVKSSRWIGSLKNNFWKFRSGHLQLFFTTSVLKNFVILTGKHLRWSLFLIKLKSWRSAGFLKRDSTAFVFLWISRNF